MKFRNPHMYSSKINEKYRKALREVNAAGPRSLREIQVDTALTWCGRACAAATLASSMSSSSDAARLEHDAIEYGHEALEHAALTDDDDLLREVRAALRECGVE